jgi:molecular chaperone GrpE (heat shock protein)
MKKNSSADPREHTQNIKEEFKKLSDHLREDVEKIDDPKAKALFEVSAEVIDGLEKAFTDYETKNESAWKDK